MFWNISGVKKIPQVKIFPENNLEQKNNREAEKYTWGTPQNFEGCKTKLLISARNFRTVRRNCESLLPTKIFSTLEKFKFQSGYFLQSWL